MVKAPPVKPGPPRKAASAGTAPGKAAVAEKRRILLRLAHSGEQPEPAVTEPVRFGVQDAKGPAEDNRIHSDEILESIQCLTASRLSV